MAAYGFKLTVLNQGARNPVVGLISALSNGLQKHECYLVAFFFSFSVLKIKNSNIETQETPKSIINDKEKWFTWFCLLVALNYQTEGRMMQLNRAKFMVNGGIGYVLKPPPMCKGNEQNRLHRWNHRHWFIQFLQLKGIPLTHSCFISELFFTVVLNRKGKLKTKKTNKKTLERLCKAEINPNFLWKKKRSYHCVIFCRFSHLLAILDRPPVFREIFPSANCSNIAHEKQKQAINVMFPVFLGQHNRKKYHFLFKKVSYIKN